MRREKSRELRVRVTGLLVTLCAMGAMASPGLASGPDVRNFFRRYSLAEGLSQASVYAIHQDRRGFIWIGTQDGLNRFDGYEFRIFQNDPADATSLANATVYAIHESRSGDLWVGTWIGGLCRFDRSSNSFERVSFAAGSADSGADTIRTIYEDANGILWIGTEDGLVRFEPATRNWKAYRHDENDPTSLERKTVLSIVDAGDGSLWIATGRGLSRFDTKAETFSSVELDTLGEDEAVTDLLLTSRGHLWLGTWGEGLYRYHLESGAVKRFAAGEEKPGEDRIAVLMEDPEGRIWVGTDGAGLRFTDSDGESFVSYRHDPRRTESISSDLVSALFRDHAGALWIGSDGDGLSVLDPNARKFAHYAPDPFESGGLASRYVNVLFEDREGVLWVGTWGKGLDRFDRRTSVVTNYRHDPGNPQSIGSDIVYAVAEDRDGTIWVGQEAGGLSRLDRKSGNFKHYLADEDNPRSVSDDFVDLIFIDSEGTLWAGTYSAGLCRFDRETDDFTVFRHDDEDEGSLGGDQIYSIVEDSEGFLWIGTDSGGVDRFDRRTGRVVEHFRHDPDDPSSLSSDSVMIVFEDSNKTIWVGTYGGGLNRLDSSTRKFRRYGVDDGLPSSVVYAILEDAKGRLWLSTNGGISRFDPMRGKFRNFDEADGLQSREFNSGAFFHSPSGEMFFGGNNGFNAFFPDDIEDDPFVPPIVLTSFKKFNEAITLDTAVSEIESITLDYWEDVFSFEFAALSYTWSQKNRYAYKLEGFRDDWIDLGTKRDITFTNLDPGKYVFRVRGSNHDGIWNEEGLAIRITILPPFWDTWWFRILASVAIAAIILTAFLVKSRSMRRRNQELQLLNRELESKNSELEQFTYTVSHDLKSPLLTIRGFLGLLKRDIKAGNLDQAVDDLGQIDSASETMARLLDELLDLSRVGQKANPGLRVSLDEVVAKAEDQVRGQLDERGVVFQVESSLPDVAGDPVRLVQLFQNLIDNACKFMGEQKAPKITIGATSIGAWAQCWVRDNGIGIDSKNHEKIFGLFDRLSSDTAGTGVGLALVERIVENHGGRVWVESEGEGRGSTFWVALPLASDKKELVETPAG